MGGTGCVFSLGVLSFCETYRSVMREVFRAFQHGAVKSVVDLVERAVVKCRIYQGVLLTWSSCGCSIAGETE